MILEVCSDKEADKRFESDRPRLLIQAACLTRLWNHLLGGREMVIMAIYVEKDLIVSRYLFFQGNGPLQYVVYSSNLHSVLIQVQVEHVLREFNLEIPQQAFEFLFQLYNFVSTVKTTASELDLTKDGTGLGEKISRGFQSSTDEVTEGTKRQSDQWDDEDDRRGSTKHQRQEDSALNRPDISHALAEEGYHVRPEEEEIEGWTPLDPVCRFSFLKF
jgi:hypothetical protein